MAETLDEIASVVSEQLHRLGNVLSRSEADPRPVALMLCGVAGAGKSTYARTLCKVRSDYERLSIDGILAKLHGLVGIDYPKEDYERFQDDADVEFETSARRILQEGKNNIVLDRSFYAKEDRDHYRSLVRSAGGRVALLHLKVPKAVLWQRIHDRRQSGINADCALDISKELLDFYFDGFESPEGEGEIVIETALEQHVSKA